MVKLRTLTEIRGAEGTEEIGLWKVYREKSKSYSTTSDQIR